ncbi:putative gustatory receptor 28b [Aethina tumida]|uniref:putative gustatory receptor 28b n=1 Tax=Aethina tumida TaxID=116153 RepID=UPI002149317B|nr:putative gustatory receptor 28b [Aethina tumida]
MFASVIVRSCLVLQTIRIDLLQQLTMFFATLTKALVIYYFIAMVLQLNIRFNMVNSFIQKKSKTNKEDTMIVTDYIKPLKVEDDLYFLCRQHYRICNGARLLNWAFGLQILASVSVTLADILFQSYYLYHILFQKVPYVTALMILRPVTWLIDESIQTYLLVIACANLCDSANSTPVLLHHFRNLINDIELENHIQMYSLQMLHQKIKFTALGFFAIDYTLIYSIIGVVTTYLVIFIQFDQSSTGELEATNDTCSSVKY